MTHLATAHASFFFLQGETIERVAGGALLVLAATLRSARRRYGVTIPINTITSGMSAASITISGIACTILLRGGWTVGIVVHAIPSI
jgi:predicted exporter